MPFYIRKYSKKSHKTQIEDAVLNSLTYIAANSKCFRTPSYVVLNDFNVNGGISFQSSNQIYDDAFFTLQLIRQHVDESISVISIEDGAVPIVRININNSEAQRGLVVDMSTIINELRNSSDLQFRQRLSWVSFLFFILGFVLFIVSLPDTRVTINDTYMIIMSFVNNMISKYTTWIQPPQIQPSITFKLF